MLAASTADFPNRSAKARTVLTYFWRHGRRPDLASPKRFTELVQWRKLHVRDARMSAFADKVRVKRHVADVLGEGWVIPTLWSGRTMPAAFDWQSPCVFKSRYGCNQILFLRKPPHDYDALRKHGDGWTSKRYGYWLDEWLYGEIPRGILLEPYIGEANVLPIDYKFYVFGGRVTHIQVHLDRGSRHRWILFDRDWRRVSSASADADPARPRSFNVMIDAAELLGRGFDFVRIDLYDIAVGPKFGEMTFYPGSGLDPFQPAALDTTLGGLWRRAMTDAAFVQPELTLADGLLPATA
jgi:TupA-like ATPgrasp